MADLKKIFNYDRVTCMLLDREQAYADFSPMDGVPLIPAWATDVVPTMKLKEGEVHVFDVVGNRWVARKYADLYPPAPIAARVETPAPAEPGQGPSLPAIPPPVVPLSLEQRLSILRSRVQVDLDSMAQFRGYDNVTSAISYRGDPNPQYAAEAEAFFVLRSKAWTIVNDVLQSVVVGVREDPSYEELAAMLPTLEIPSAPVAQGEGAPSAQE